MFLCLILHFVFLFTLQGHMVFRNSRRFLVLIMIWLFFPRKGHQKIWVAIRRHPDNLLHDYRALGSFRLTQVCRGLLCKDMTGNSVMEATWSAAFDGFWLCFVFVLSASCWFYNVLLVRAVHKSCKVPIFFLNDDTSKEMVRHLQIRLWYLWRTTHS